MVTDLFWIMFVTAIAVCLLALGVQALEHVHNQPPTDIVVT